MRRFNPTEAGSRGDDVGAKSSSVLLSLKAEGNALETVTQMAFWQTGQLAALRL